ncbi:MAG: FAD-dependent oxidoreductase [Dehalococcoidia bacterium]|nr:FAD-dependent oxidoreductase [Dehalococcoidia bacterium]
MTVRVRQDNCIACEACVVYCPMDAIRMMDGVAVIDEDRCVECGLCSRAATTRGLLRTPCSRACPAGVDVPRYLQYVADGDPAAALLVIRERLPFPSVCGHVCFHPCEAHCARGRLDEPLAIRALKRFATEHGDGLPAAVAPAPTGKRIAVVGAGPAGLTAAYYLVRLGHSVTVYEALEQPGGMMLLGIPEYRLPRRLVEAEIQRIENAGVRIVTGRRISSPVELFRSGHDAVFVASGAHRPVGLNLPGEHLPNVIPAVGLLREVRSGSRMSIGEVVAVIGGGNSAIEAGRTALRLGARSVTVYYRRNQAEMPATREAYMEAVDEGIRFRFRRMPVRIEPHGDRLALLHAAAAAQGVGERPEMVPITDTVLREVVDTVVVAIGQRTNLPAGFGLACHGDGLIAVNRESLGTSVPGVFAGGDAVIGPASVVEAIAHGRRGAVAIDRYLGGPGIIEEVLAPVEESVQLREPLVGQARCSIPSVSVAQRLRSPEPVELSLGADAATREARRCLRCDVRRRECIAFEPSEWPRALRNHFSQSGVPHATTGIAGRGTEEMKTNDVTGRFQRGMVGLGLDVGRPGVGTSFRDVDVLTRCLASLGAHFESNNPITMMMQDVSIGSLLPAVLDERVLSCVIEASFPLGRLPEMLEAVRQAAAGIDTVVSVCCIGIADGDGTYELQRRLDELGIPYRPNGKQNVGLGRPQAPVIGATP